MESLATLFLALLSALHLQTSHGAEPAPPRPRIDRLLNWPLLARAYLFLGLMQAAVAMSACWFVLRHGGRHLGEQLVTHDPLYLRATTACLGAIVVMQIANVFLCRSNRQSLLAH